MAMTRVMRGCGAALTAAAVGGGSWIMTGCEQEPHALDMLWSRVVSRVGADPEISMTAKLIKLGPKKCGQRVGEEAVQTATEVAISNKRGVICESADLLYHLQVSWAAVGVTPEEVYQEIRVREGVSGIPESRHRPAWCEREYLSLIHI
eukprot:TRINITY_DN1724_c0_g1_i5.p1 TRINITY_DN1724_c0_g1~~TRINITY_DN1724_c0_g1_i5.p1  ORF type:complete len:149 (-),score=23.32 TRINITY_DN1724_c0_g1_i5:122-568(-)